MARNAPALIRVLFALCIGVTASQWILLIINPHATLISNTCICVAAALSVAACFAKARGGLVATRRLWLLLALAFFLSLIGQVGSTFHELHSQNYAQMIALNTDFLFFAYGIPFLLAICSGKHDAGLNQLIWLDSAQAIVAALLAYLQIFTSLPYFSHPVPISAEALFYLYNAENLILAVTVTLRLLSKPDGGRVAFYSVAAVYLWTYGAVAFLLGYIELHQHAPDGLQDAGWMIPYLALLYAAMQRPRHPEDVPASRSGSLELLVDNLSPILFTLAIVLMGVSIAFAHRLLAFTCIGTAVILYGIRAALLQGGFVRSQQDLTQATYGLLEANDSLMKLSMMDALTGIYNRRYLDELLRVEWDRSKRIGQSLSLLMIDVDCFKALNDRYGHQKGDDCLRAIASDVRAKLRRAEDSVARYGGEEFVIVLPGANIEGAFIIAEEIRCSIVALNFPNEASTVHSIVTASIGVASQIPADAHTPSELLRAADAALYCAKQSGRNRSHCYVHRPPVGADEMDIAQWQLDSARQETSDVQ